MVSGRHGVPEFTPTVSVIWSEFLPYTLVLLVAEMTLFGYRVALPYLCVNTACDYWGIRMMGRETEGGEGGMKGERWEGEKERWEG